MSKLLDAQDELSRARDLVELIAMTAAVEHTPEQKAIATGCEFIRQRFEEAFRFLEEFKAET